LPIDGVLLSLHGALVAEHLEDCEGCVLAQVRKAVGPGVPVVSSLDYHACITKQLVECADLLVGYRTYPHVDYAETGSRTAAGLLRLLIERPKLKAEFRKLPLMLPAENTETGSGPMAAAIEKLKALDSDSGIAAASVFTTQPWLDVTEHGVSVVLYSVAGTNAAPAADAIADYIWRSRKEFFLKFPSVAEYLDNIERYAKPAIVVDSGVITSAGAAGDSTEILRALLERKSKPRTVLTLVDPAAVAQALEIGEGNRGKVIVGGRQGKGYNAPVQVSAKVARISDSKVTMKGETFRGMELHLGRRVRLDIDGGISLIVFERSSMFHDPEVPRSMGLNPEEFDLIAQKSHKMFRAAYAKIAKSVTILDTPGFSDMNLKRLPFKCVKRPIYPLDEL